MSDIAKSVFKQLYDIDTRGRAVEKDTGRTKLDYLPWAVTYSEVAKNFEDIDYGFDTYEKEIYKTNRDARTLAANVEKKKSASDSEYFQAAEALSRAKIREGEIEAKYFPKFAKILSKKQMFLLKQAEVKFTRTMIRGGKRK